jgi:hypothetical protein
MYNHIHKRTPLHCNTSLHFTTLHPTTLHYTYRHLTPSRLIIIIIIIIIIIPIWTLHPTPRFTPLPCNVFTYTFLPAGRLPEDEPSVSKHIEDIKIKNYNNINLENVHVVGLGCINIYTSVHFIACSYIHSLWLYCS